MLPTHKFRRLYGPLVKRIIPLIVVIAFLVVVAKVVVWSKQFMDATGLTPVTILKLVFNTGVSLKETDGRTNILVLGIAGGTHAGSDLTDTMIVLSFDMHKRTLAMIAIPRDIWSETLKDKINSAYHYGEDLPAGKAGKKEGGGIVLSRVIVEDVTGLPIHYTMLIDFSGFEDVIDLVSGVTVAVPQAFTDPDFPIAGREEDVCGGDPQFRCRYESVSFEQGLQEMSGERALMYVRSRHAEGEEGSDFARSRRQQDVMIALKEKLITPNVYLSPSRLRDIVNAFDNATETDVRVGEFATVGKIVSRIPESKVVRISLEDQLVEPPLWQYGRYVLVPKEDYASLHAYIKEKISL